MLFIDALFRLAKTPSEPALNDEHAYETILYHTEDVEILSSPFLVSQNFCENEIFICLELQNRRMDSGLL